jgi:hypothetical protein
MAAVLKVIAVLSAAAALAGVLVLTPGMTPVVQADIYSIKGDRLDLHAYGTSCSQRAWPYFEASCLRDTNSSTRRARVVRIVSTDRLADGQ